MICICTWRTEVEDVCGGADNSCNSQHKHTNTHTYIHTYKSLHAIVLIAEIDFDFGHDCACHAVPTPSAWASHFGHAATCVCFCMFVCCMKMAWRRRWRWWWWWWRWDGRVNGRAPSSVDSTIPNRHTQQIWVLIMMSSVMYVCMSAGGAYTCKLAHKYPAYPHTYIHMYISMRVNTDMMVGGERQRCCWCLCFCGWAHWWALSASGTCACGILVI